VFDKERENIWEEHEWLLICFCLNRTRSFSLGSIIQFLHLFFLCFFLLYLLFLINPLSDGSRTIIDIEADGNCLFRAISDQLYHDYGNNHAEIRMEICDYMTKYKEDFEVFLVLDDKDAVEDDGEDASDFETYMHNMRQDGDWGGHLELVAAARMYR